MSCCACGAEAPAGGACPACGTEPDAGSPAAPISEGDLPTLRAGSPEAQLVGATTLTGGGLPTPATPAASAPDAAELVFEGKYRTRGLIGQGGMGRVYRGWDSLLDRTVAIKVLKGAHQGDDAFLRRFHHEAKTLAALEHPSIVPIYSFGREHGQCYFVMRLIEGVSLRKRSRRAWPLEEILTRLRPICEGLDYIHRRGVIHRDLKPDNIVFTADEHPILIDFGVALDPALSRLTEGQAVMGTPTYMSPEQALCVPELTPASDQYSLAVIVYELLCGVLPFTGVTPMAVLFQQVNTPPIPPEIRSPGVPPRVGQALLRALSKDPTERYASCPQLWEALALANSASAAPSVAAAVAAPEAQDSVETAPARPATRPSWPAAGLAVVLLVVAGVVAVLGLPRWLAAPATVAPVPGSPPGSRAAEPAATEVAPASPTADAGLASTPGAGSALASDAGSDGDAAAVPDAASSSASPVRAAPRVRPAAARPAAPRPALPPSPPASPPKVHDIDDYDDAPPI